MQLTPQGLYDIYGLWHVPFWYRPSFWFFYVAIPGVCLLVLSLFFYIKRKKTHRKQSCWHRALYALEQLQQHISDEKTNELYTHMLTILKRYLDERYAISATTKTDEELIPYLKKQPSCQAIVDEMEQLNKNAIYIKYANQPLDRQTIEKHLLIAQSLVRHTIIQQQSPTL